MISNLGKYIPIIFILISVFVLCDSLISLVELHNIPRDQHLITHSYEVINGVEITVANIVKAETDQRNYVISNNQSFLTAYQNDWSNISKNFASLHSLTNGNKAQQIQISILQQDFLEKRKLLDQAITIYQMTGLTDAQIFITSNEGSNILNRIVHEEEVIVTNENSTLLKRNSAFDTNTYLMYSTIIISTILNILLILFAYIAIMREFRQRTLLESKKNEFISLASHELKTPLTTMSIFGELLSKETAIRTSKKSSHILSRMRNQIDEMNSLINHLLDVTRIQFGKLELQKEYTILNTIIEEVVEDTQAITKKHTIRFKKAAPANVFVDKKRIWQVLSNLLINAVKYSPDGGKIEVTLKTTLTKAKVSIKDSGIGISKANQEHIFERYFREEGDSQKKYSGLGLGLYLSQQILHLHKGRIWVRSTQGSGSEFSFTLPLVRRKKKI